MFFKQSLEIMAHPRSEQSGLIVAASFCLGNEASFPQDLGTSSLRERERELGQAGAGGEGAATWGSRSPAAGGPRGAGRFTAVSDVLRKER